MKKLSAAEHKRLGRKDKGNWSKLLEADMEYFPELNVSGVLGRSLIITAIHPSTDRCMVFYDGIAWVCRLSKALRHNEDQSYFERRA